MRGLGFPDGKPPKTIADLDSNIQTAKGSKQLVEAVFASEDWLSYPGTGHALGLVLVGPTGTGKSHILQAAIYQAFLQGERSYYLNTGDFDRLIKRFDAAKDDPDSLDPTPEDFIAQMCGESYYAAGINIKGFYRVAIDDVGAGYTDKSGFTAAKLEYVIDRRIRAEKPFALATNLEAEQFRAHVGERIWSRLMDKRTCRIAVLADAKDVRAMG